VNGVLFITTNWGRAARLRCGIFSSARHLLRPLPRQVCLCIDVASKSGEFLVRLLFLFERFIEKRDMIRLAKFLREGDHRAVRRPRKMRGELPRAQLSKLWCSLISCPLMTLKSRIRCGLMRPANTFVAQSLSAGIYWRFDWANTAYRCCCPSEQRADCCCFAARSRNPVEISW
jgi:hypothetical protein